MEKEHTEQIQKRFTTSYDSNKGTILCGTDIRDPNPLITRQGLHCEEPHPALDLLNKVKVNKKTCWNQLIQCLLNANTETELPA